VAQERTVAALRFAPTDFLAKTQATDEAAKAYYDSNQAMFETPEQADIEYVVLSADAIGASIKISDDDLKQYYAQNKARYSVPEERLASHILIAVPAGASDAVRQQARAKAESVQAQLRKTPGDFARLAKQYSDDPISKERGGDLEYYARGVMVKPFDDALFALKQGEISDIVTTTDGFHLIKATAIRPAETRSLESVRGDIETEVRQQLAKKKVAESIDTFSNVVYEQLDSLKPAATQLGLQIKTATGLTRAGAKGDPILSNAKFLAALFADDATRDKHNTKAIEVAPNTLVSGRVTNYRARTVKPFDEVKPMVVEAVRAQEALRLAKEAGAAAFANWREGKGVGTFAAPEKLSRSVPSTVPADAMRAIFKVNATKLPAYVGVDLGAQGYAVYRIDAVGKGNVPDAEAQRKAISASLERAVSEAEFNATIDALRARTKVEVMQSSLSAAP
jgi:peptidyl-prolyl cis-trans isomerase D